jgi:hypothetical protein
MSQPPRQPPRLPDLDTLTSAEKDALIVSLWETVQALDGGGQAAAPAPAPVARDRQAPNRGELSARIGASAASTRGTRREDSRGWLSRLLDYRPLQILIGLIALGFLADFAIGWQQRREAAARQQEMLLLEQSAFSGLFMEVTRAGAVPEPNSYQATLRLQRTLPGGTMYVLQNPPRVFVQTGLVWREVPSRAPDGGAWGMIRLTDGIDITVLFEIDVEGWSELIPGYMHVQLQFDQLISLSAEPGDDIVERNNRFFFYLKPQGADDAAIAAKAGFKGAPPAYIPMPPH